VLLWLCAAKIAAVILALDPAGLVAFQLPKALISHAFDWPIAAALLIALAIGGRAMVPTHRLHLAVAAIAAVAVVSALFASDRYVAIFGDSENYQGLTFVVDMALLYVATAVAVRAERDALVLLGAALAAGAVSIAYGLAQSLGLDPLGWEADPRLRPFATFGNADHFGHFLSVFFGIALGLALAATGVRVRASGAVAVLGALVMSAIVATRATVLGIVAALVAAAAVTRPTARALIAAVVAVAVGGMALAITPLGQRLIGGASVSDRVELWNVALRASLARPILGYGPDNFRAAFATHRTVESLSLLGAGPQGTAHDWILDASATTGMLGLGALVVLIAIGTIELWRLALDRPSVGVPIALGWAAYWADGLVAAASMAAAWYPWIALGSVVALRGTRSGGAARRTVPRWAMALLALVALFGAATGLRALQANRDAWASEEATHFGDLSEAVIFADRAAARDSGRADYWNRLGLALEGVERRTDAVNAYREATRRGPYEAVYWANLARSLARVAGSDQSIREDAITSARQGTVVDPNAPVGHVVLAEISIAFGRCDLALSEATRAASLEVGHDELVGRARSCR
jgi:O-antigen ligase